MAGPSLMLLGASLLFVRNQPIRKAFTLIIAVIISLQAAPAELWSCKSKCNSSIENGSHKSCCCCSAEQHRRPSDATTTARSGCCHSEKKQSCCRHSQQNQNATTPGDELVCHCRIHHPIPFSPVFPTRTETERQIMTLADLAVRLPAVKSNQAASAASAEQFGKQVNVVIHIRNCVWLT